MNLKKRKESFVLLGEVLVAIGNNLNWPGYKCGVTKDEFEDLKYLAKNIYKYNGWFSEEMVRKSMLSIGNSLSRSSIEKWISQYENDLIKIDTPKKIGVIMAGNIPLVGFHDFLCVLISGNEFLGKCSSKDDRLLEAVANLLITINPEFRARIDFVDGKLDGMDAIIATGSNNSNRYFERYFSKYPSILRKGRSSIAILNGNETDEELKGLGNDMLDYYGLGCRNVSKLFVPIGYDLNKVIGNIINQKNVLNNNKYTNNYDYQKALFLMNKDLLLENGFLLFKEDKNLFSPMATVYYEFYEGEEDLTNRLKECEENIQCIVSSEGIPFGMAQNPELWDYADGIDTIKFLCRL